MDQTDASFPAQQNPYSLFIPDSLKVQSPSGPVNTDCSSTAQCVSFMSFGLMEASEAELS